MLNRISFALMSVLLMIGLNSYVDAQSTTKSKTAGWDRLSDSCKTKLFPVSSGGSKDEKVSCTLHDPNNDLIIVAGNTTSEDYAPAANDHAFMYALDMEGNWKWGKFFYNVSFALATISGCTLDANGNAVLLGMGNSVPVILEVAPKDGTITQFTNFEKIGTTDTAMPWYGTYAAIHHDLNDIDDGKSYYYVSFVIGDDNGGAMQMIKINSRDRTIKWNYETNKGTKAAPQKKIPGFLHQDPNDRTRMFLLGQYNQRASVMKFEKRSMNLDWKLEIKDPDGAAAPASAMHEIYSYVQPPQSR